jgi:hypothetical protein
MTALVNTGAFVYSATLNQPQAASDAWQHIGLAN